MKSIQLFISAYFKDINNVAEEVHELVKGLGYRTTKEEIISVINENNSDSVLNNVILKTSEGFKYALEVSRDNLTIDIINNIYSITEGVNNKKLIDVNDSYLVKEIEEMLETKQLDTFTDPLDFLSVLNKISELAELKQSTRNMLNMWFSLKTGLVPKPQQLTKTVTKNSGKLLDRSSIF